MGDRTAVAATALRIGMQEAATEEEALAAIPGLVQVHHNPTGWYNNASFALPLAAAVVVAIAGLILRRGDVLAFAGFLFAVTACMVPDHEFSKVRSGKPTDQRIAFQHIDCPYDVFNTRRRVRALMRQEMVQDAIEINPYLRRELDARHD